MYMYMYMAVMYIYMYMMKALHLNYIFRGIWLLAFTTYPLEFRACAHFALCAKSGNF